MKNVPAVCMLSDEKVRKTQVEPLQPDKANTITMPTEIHMNVCCQVRLINMHLKTFENQFLSQPIRAGRFIVQVFTLQTNSGRTDISAEVILSPAAKRYLRRNSPVPVYIGRTL
jgi:hypothetical protein